MKTHKKHISKALFFIFIAFILLFSGMLIYQIQETKSRIFTDFDSCLEVSVKKYINDKTKNVYHFANYEYNPQKGQIGEYETRTARYADTTFTYQSKIVDSGTSAFRGYQTLFLDIDQLHADSIRIILNSFLQKKNIHVESIVGITASFYTKKNEWSGDTTALDINYRTTFVNQGNYEDINYYAYIHYSPATIWKLMSKSSIYILLICNIIIGLILIWWIRKQRQEKINGIVLLKNGSYRIKNILFIVAEKRLTSEDKETRLTSQLHELLLLFLMANNYRVSKKNIKHHFWPNNIDPTGNMTSAVNRLNKALKEIDCAYTISSDPKNAEYYTFAQS